MLQARASGPSSARDDLQLQLSVPTDGSVILADIDAFIAAPDSRRNAVQTDIDAVALRGVSGTTAQSAAVTRLLADGQSTLARLDQQLAAEQGSRRELSQARGMACETFTAVSKKAEESSLAASGVDATARIASMAVPSDSPVAGWTVPAASFGALAGFLLGALIALVRGSPLWLGPRPQDHGVASAN